VRAQNLERDPVRDRSQRGELASGSGPSPLRGLLAKLPPDPNPTVARLRKQVLDAFAGRRSADAVPSALVEQLSERELTVLRRLPSSRSNQGCSTCR
jgi:hypothetical protein